MNKKYESELMGTLHETAVGLHKIGLISDKEMSEYDRDCLVSETQPIYGNSSAQNQSIPAYAAPGK